MFCPAKVRSCEPAQGVLNAEDSSSDTSEILEMFDFVDDSKIANVSSNDSIGEWSDNVSTFIEVQRRALEEFN